MSILFIVVGIGFLALPVGILVLVVYAMLLVRFAKHRRHWKQANGVIEESSVQYEDGAEFAKIRYKFWVDDQPYWGDELSENGIFDGSKPHRIVARYPVGKSIESVFYDPAEPENESELEIAKTKSRTKGSIFDFLHGVFVLLVFLVLGSLLIYLGFNPNVEWNPIK